MMHHHDNTPEVDVPSSHEEEVPNHSKTFHYPPFVKNHLYLHYCLDGDDHDDLPSRDIVVSNVQGYCIDDRCILRVDLDGAFVASVVAVVSSAVVAADEIAAAAAAAVGDDEMVDKEMVEKMVEVVHPHYYFFDS